MCVSSVANPVITNFLCVVMSNILEKLGLTDGCEREIKLGKSFFGNGHSQYHTFRYDFKPASVDFSKMATVDIGEGNQVTVTVPHVDRGSGPTHTVFKGCKKPYRKECVLVIDHKTGEITLEKLTYNVQLKKTRAEGSSKISQSFLENNLATKKSPLQRRSPLQRSLLSSNSNSATTSKCSPKSSKSPNSQQSQSTLPSRASPSVPCIAPLPGPSTVSKHFSQTAPVAFTLKAGASTPISRSEASEIGVMSSSGSSSDSSGSSSDSESSDDEAKAKAPTTNNSRQTNGKAGGAQNVATNSKSTAAHKNGLAPRNASPTAARFTTNSLKTSGHNTSKANGNLPVPQVKGGSGVLPKVNGKISPSFKVNGNSNSSKKTKPVSQPALLSMPKISLLSEDLKLSESDSD